MGGLEVEERRPVAPPFSNVVVGHVRKVDRHPNADKLTVCTSVRSVLLPARPAGAA